MPVLRTLKKVVFFFCSMLLADADSTQISISNLSFNRTGQCAWTNRKTRK